MKKNIYFEPPSRLQLLDKLKHFVRFSDFLLLVSGDNGIGKSTLLAQLKPDEEDSTFCCCFIRLDAEISEQQLLTRLMQQFPSHEQSESGFADQLKAFHLQLKAMQAAGQKCLIAIDDAEHLSEDALALLLNLHIADAQVLLTSGSAFMKALLAGDSVRHLEGRIHHLEIKSMSDGEVAEYIELCHPAVSSLPEKKKNELIRLSEGVPGRIETLLAGGKVSLSQRPSQRKAFPLPALHMLGIGALLIAIVAISLWQFVPEESASGVVSGELASGERVSVPLSVAIEEAAEKVAEIVPVEVSDSSEVVAQATLPSVESKTEVVDGVAPETYVKTDLTLRLQQQEEKLRNEKAVVLKKAPLPQTKSKSSDLEDELRAVVTQTRPSVQKTPVVVTEQSPSISQIEDSSVSTAPQPKSTLQNKALKFGSAPDESTLLSWKPSGYTLQMTGARSKQSALDFIASQSNPSQFYYFETVYKGLPWHVVIYGQYPNRDIANASIRKLPKKLQNVKPWARSVQGVQIDIRKKKPQ